MPPLAADLVRARVDVIEALSPPAIQAAKDATKTIPAVMAHNFAEERTAGSPALAVATLRDR